jgi:hypothetical protein
MILMFYFWKKIKQSRGMINQEEGKKTKKNNHTSRSGPRGREREKDQTKPRSKGKERHPKRIKGIA